MADFNFEELLEAYLPEGFEKGEEKEVTIIRKDRDYTYLDINGKLEGRVKSEEVEEFEEGQVIKVQVVSEDKEGNYVLCSRRKIEIEENMSKLEEAYKDAAVLTGEVVKRVNGGYIVEVLKVSTFMPNSLSLFRKSENGVGKEVKVLIKEMKEERGKKKILVSRKDVKARAEKAQLEEISVGEIHEVEVKEILGFGLSVAVGPISGFIHISEVAWNRIDNLNELYKIGDKLQAKVIEKDASKKSVKLSIKQLTEDPWTNIESKYPLEAEVEGTVIRTSNFGAFIELEKGIEGLVHISDLTWSKKLKSVEEYVKVGDKVKVKVTVLNTEDKKLKLSIKELQRNPWEVAMENISIDSVVKGKVVEVKDFGMFVNVADEVDAFVHISDYSWDKVAKDYYKIGDEVEVRIIEIDEANEKIKAGVKQLTKSPWEELKENYKVGDVLAREITSITDFGMFVEVQNGIDGMIHISEASKDFIKNINEKYKVGDEIEAEIIEINDDKQKVKLSVKKLELNKAKKEERDLIEKYSVVGDEE
jgi:ribosomal protein S1